MYTLLILTIVGIPALLCVIYFLVTENTHEDPNDIYYRDIKIQELVKAEAKRENFKIQLNESQKMLKLPALLQAALFIVWIILIFVGHNYLSGSTIAFWSFWYLVIATFSILDR